MSAFPFTLEEELGRGAMGCVFRARQEGDGRVVAVKLLLAEGGERELLEAARRLRDEAAAAMRVACPSLLAPLRVGEDARRGPWIAYPLLSGRTLADRLAEAGPMNGADCLRLVAEPLLRALDALHRAGIVHRDVKASNCLESGTGDYLLADLGLAHFDGREARTRTGTFAGTPATIAPERIGNPGAPSGPAGDLYAAAQLLAECFGVPLPWAELAPAPALAMRLRFDWTGDALAAGGVPPPLVPALLRALSRDPERRPTALALLEALRAPEDDASRANTLMLRPPPAGAPPGDGKEGVTAPLRAASRGARSSPRDGAATARSARRFRRPILVALLGATLLFAFWGLARRSPRTTDVAPPTRRADTPGPAGPSSRLSLPAFPPSLTEAARLDALCRGEADLDRLEDELTRDRGDDAPLRLFVRAARLTRKGASPLLRRQALERALARATERLRAGAPVAPDRLALPWFCLRRLHDLAEQLDADAARPVEEALVRGASSCFALLARQPSSALRARPGRDLLDGLDLLLAASHLRRNPQATPPAWLPYARRLVGVPGRPHALAFLDALRPELSPPSAGADEEGRSPVFGEGELARAPWDNRNEFMRLEQAVIARTLGGELGEDRRPRKSYDEAVRQYRVLWWRLMLETRHAGDGARPRSDRVAYEYARHCDWLVGAHRRLGPLPEHDPRNFVSLWEPAPMAWRALLVLREWAETVESDRADPTWGEACLHRFTQLHRGWLENVHRAFPETWRDWAHPLEDACARRRDVLPARLLKSWMLGQEKGGEGGDATLDAAVLDALRRRRDDPAPRVEVHTIRLVTQLLETHHASLGPRQATPADKALHELADELAARWSKVDGDGRWTDALDGLRRLLAKRRQELAQGPARSLRKW